MRRIINKKPLTKHKQRSNKQHLLTLTKSLRLLKFQEKKWIIGHTPRKKKIEMKIKHQIIISALTALLLTPTKSEAVVVRQELYRFQMTMTQNVTTTTFLICDQHQVQAKPAIGFRLNLVHFELGSAVLSAVEAETMLSDLKQHGITSKTPLAVIGYTCMLGPDIVNQQLSLKRADVVADFLRDHGFVVAHVQGQGATNPITYNLQEFYKNRRVQITVCP